jgi:hypothetical protein
MSHLFIIILSGGIVPISKRSLQQMAVLIVIAASSVMVVSCKEKPKPNAANDFASIVKAANPLAYYRLKATSGASQVGASTYKAVGGVSMGDSAPPTGAENKSVVLNGKDGWISTTQAGGIGSAASMMAWVNLAALPSDAHHFFYVVGESESGNDLDLQFENDNAIRFYTAAGSHLEYQPDAKSLVNHWHMVVVTQDTDAHGRALYWDGQPVKSDQDAGKPTKTAPFSIGNSPVFGGRWFAGNIDEVALWNRALTATEVAAIYNAAK